MVQRIIQLTGEPVTLATWLKTHSTTAPSTSPPGQPACRMFSQWVLLVGNNVAVSGLMTASQVPLPSENDNCPTQRHQNAAVFPDC
jgi:hypothetical protein